MGLCLSLAACAGLRPPDDFAQIRQNGELRLGLWRPPAAENTQPIDPILAERAKLKDLALNLGLKARFVPFADLESMAEALKDGQIDLAATHIAPQKAYQGLISSVDYLRRDFVWIERAGAQGALCLRQQSPQAELASRQQTTEKLHLVSPFLSTRGLLSKLEQEHCRATVVDRFYWQRIQHLFPDLKLGKVLARSEPMAFYFRANSQQLRQRANEFLFFRALSGQGELYPQKRLARKKLRVLTRNHLMSFFLSEGNHYGLEYELLQRFASEEGYQLEMVVPSFHSDLIPWLLEGKGDLIAASMTATKERKKLIQFTAPYHLTNEWVVVRAGDRKIRRLRDLAGASIWVRRSSSYYGTLKQAEQLVGGIDIQLAPEDLETEQLFEQLEQGRIDALVADRNQLKAETTFGRPVRGAVRLPGRSALAFGLRPGDQELADRLNTYLYRIGRDGFLKIVKEKYTENKTLITKARSTARADTHGEISPYDRLIRQVALDHNLDWRLVASQMYQESRFDRTRKSSAGALGLMQVLPTTAEEVGLKAPLKELLEPQPAIEAGVRYLKKTFERLDEVPRLEDRIYFSLAAYNAGYGHLSDARKLAEQMGLDRDRWSGQVEKAILLLEQPRYYRRARYGYCRGSEPVHYVQEIKKRYVMYTQFVPPEAL